ncbi:hypothetical protein FB451DRAFT_1184486 [Mycena latifolia]|nr:hypothetical protein FB451DRAFT_1184486 [Mycena latifolia]
MGSVGRQIRVPAASGKGPKAWSSTGRGHQCTPGLRPHFKPDARVVWMQPASLKSFPGCKTPFLALMPLHIAIIVAGLLCSNREGDDAYRLSREAMVVMMERCAATDRADHCLRIGVGECDVRAREIKESRLLTGQRARSRRDTVHRQEEQQYDPACRVRRSAPRIRGVVLVRRLATESAGYGHASEEPRMHDSAGYAARASRAEAALPTDRHSGGSGSAPQVGASCVRSPSSPAHLLVGKLTRSKRKENTSLKKIITRLGDFLNNRRIPFTIYNCAVLNW